MNKIFMDLETFSSVDIHKCGVYKYASSSDFEILLFAYSIDGGPAKVIDIAQGEKIPQDIIDALYDEKIQKWSFNNNFERVCLSSFVGMPVGTYFNPKSWYCSMIWSAYMGLPLSLKGVGAVLKLDEQKMSKGKDLIKYFCCPCTPSKTNGGRTRNLPHHAPDKWRIFKEYNKRDVEVEMSIQEKLRKFPVPVFVWDEYHHDQSINDRGILVDKDFVTAAINVDNNIRNKNTTELQQLTRLENPNSVLQMRDWLKDNNLETASLDKKSVSELLKTASDDVKRVLELRQQLAKSSVKKYQAMQNAACSDNRARGMFQFYGANRTGRFAGRLVQMQNLVQNHLEDLKTARNQVLRQDFEELSNRQETIPDILSQLIRTAFIPKKGCKFIVADFSAIEARVIAWLAGEDWRMELFKTGGDIYCKSASEMFHVPVEKNGANGHLRQKGKIAELACIAEGSLVLTDQGLIPIEKVTKGMNLWDGNEWVSHDGVIYKGEREVISYEGLTATPDHLVWVEGKSKPIQFREASSSGAHLIQTGNGRKPIRMGENNIPGKKMEQGKKSLLCFNKMYRLQLHPMANIRQSSKRHLQRLSSMLTKTSNSIMARPKVNSSKTKMRKPQRSGISKLWSKRNQIRFSKCYRCWAIFNKNIWSSIKRYGNRQNQHKWRLCSGKFAIYNSPTELHKSKKMCVNRIFTKILALFKERNNKKTFIWNDTRRYNQGCEKNGYRETKKMENNPSKIRVYDIRNAGKNHRFTVSNYLVHNCGYGGSVGALKAMGAIEMGLTDEELQPLVNSWRSSNPAITKLWWDVDKAAMKAVKERLPSEVHGIQFFYKSGMLFIKLPSGRCLAYVKPHIGTNQFGGESITYEGVGATKKWERLETYGPKLVENIVQGIARDILCFAMKNLSMCSIVAHVHDEIIIEAPQTMSVDAVCKVMGKTPPWANGLLLRADGYECEFYRKD